jgi:cell division protein FtsN
MYKDFKKSESLDTGFVGGSGIMWMFSGIVLGLLVGVGMYYFSGNQSSPLSTVDSVQKQIEKAQSNSNKVTRVAKSTALAIKKPSVATYKQRENKFSYYAVLPTLDVPVNSARPIETRGTAILNNPEMDKKVALLNGEIEEETQIIKQGNYLLQVASFKKKSKAKLTRGRLSKSGINAYIQKKKVKGRLWYRVLAGPVDQNSVDNWKLKAEKLGHRPLIISVR